MKVEFLLVQLNKPVEILNEKEQTSDNAAMSLKTHGGNIYPILPGGKLDTFIRENFKEELT